MANKLQYVSQLADQTAGNYLFIVEWWQNIYFVAILIQLGQFLLRLF